MRITVQYGLLMHQFALAFQHFQDMGVGVKHMLTGKEFRIGQEYTVGADRIINRQAVFQADDIIVLAVAGRGMYGAGTGFRSDMVAEYDRYLPVLKRMLQQLEFPSRSFAVAYDMVILDTVAQHGILKQGFGNDQALCWALHHHIFQIGI